MNTNNDGRKNMPKSRCPYCDSRVVDSRTPTLKNSLELTLANINPNRIRFKRRIIRDNAPKSLAISVYYLAFLTFLAKNTSS